MHAGESSEERRFAAAEELLAEFLVRRETDASATIESLVAGQPDLARHLRELWAQIGEVDQAFDADAKRASEERAQTDEMLRALSAARGFADHYEVGLEIGRGGMGAILRVFDRRLGRPLAMKVIVEQATTSPDTKTPPISSRRLARFLNEALITGRLEHPGIVPVHEIGVDAQGRAYFTMKLVKGFTLTELFARRRADDGEWSTARILGVIERVCEALAFAHDRGVMHRDLKPANVMIGAFGEVYVMDWGLARRLGDSPEIAAVDEAVDEQLSEKTLEGHVVGTPAYMSPEQARGALDEMGPWSDVYAVGAMLYQLIQGRPPYLTSDTEKVTGSAVLGRIVAGPPARLHAPTTSPELIAICEKAMAYARRDRYPTVTALSEDLHRFLEQRVVLAYEAGVWAETKKWVQRNRLLATSALAIVFLLAVGGSVSTHFWLAARARAHDLEVEQQRVQKAMEETQFHSYLGSVLLAADSLSNGEIANTRRSLEIAPSPCRNWEWRNLVAQSDSSLVATKPCDARVTIVAFNRTETAFLVAASDGVVRLYDAATGAATREFHGHGGAVDAASFSPDGTRILTCSIDTTARVWSCESGAELFRLEGHGGPVRCGCFGPDGTTILTGADDALGRLWDAEDGTLLRTLSGHEKAINGGVFSPDGSEVLTASDDWTARTWDAESGSVLLVLRGHTDAVTCAEYSPDQSRIVTASKDDTARVWKRDSETSITTLKGHVNTVRRAVFSPDGERIVTASADTTARVWKASTGASLATFDSHLDQVLDATFSHDEKKVVTASKDRTARVWDASTGVELETLRGHEDEVVMALFNHDDSLVLTGSADRSARLWDGRHDATPVELKANDYKVMSVAFSPDGAWILTGSTDGVARIWDATRLQQLLSLQGHSSWIRSVAFSPDGERIVTGSDDKTARIWSVVTGRPICVITGHGGSVDSAAFSTDGLRVVTASDDGTARTWDAKTGAATRTIDVGGGRVRAARFSPDGTRIVTGAEDGSVKLWASETGVLVRALRKHAEKVYSACFSVDGSRIVTASADKSARVYDASTGELVAELVGHDDEVDSAVLSSDGVRVLTASADMSVRLWDVEHSTTVFKTLCSGRVMDARFSPDGTQVLDATDHGTSQLWDSLPHRDRLRMRREFDAAEVEARKVVDEAKLGGGDLEAVATRLRARQGISPTVRLAALDLVIGMAEATRVWIEDVRSEEGDRDSVLASIQKDETHDAVVRAEALHSMAASRDDSIRLNTFAWTHGWPANLKRADYEKALRAARIAVEIDGSSVDTHHVGTLGTAQYRNDQWADSIQTFERARKLRKDGPEPTDLAFLAMAHFRLGEKTVAVELLGQLRELMRDAKWTDDKARKSLLAEAEELIGPR